MCGTDGDDKLGNIKFTLFIPFSNLSTIYLSLFSNYLFIFICNNVQRSVQPHDKVLMINASVSNIILLSWQTAILSKKLTPKRVIPITHKYPRLTINLFFKFVAPNIRKKTNRVAGMLDILKCASGQAGCCKPISGGDYS